MSSNALPDMSQRASDGPLPRWRSRVAAGELVRDPEQDAAVVRLQQLHDELRRLASANASPMLLRLLGLRREPQSPRGVYLWGGVGRGKSMLMDLFYATAPVEAKRRVHFNAFMLEIHDRIHRWRRSSESQASNGRADPIPPLADAVAAEARLLCFDEFHVVDIADAMILGRLTQALLDRGVVVVATSNWAPDELYRDGLQRDRFLPFIALVKSRLDVVRVDAGTDYRMARLKGRAVWWTPLGHASTDALDRIFADLTEGVSPEPDRIDVKGRVLEIPVAAAGVARFDFEALCARPLGAIDYLELAERYHTLMIDGIPRFDERRRAEAKRFMTLVDTLYEERAKLIASAQTTPERLLDLDPDVPGPLAFEFERTVSRLLEMQSETWLAA